MIFTVCFAMYCSAVILFAVLCAMFSFLMKSVFDFFVRDLCRLHGITTSSSCFLSVFATTRCSSFSDGHNIICLSAVSPSSKLDCCLLPSVCFVWIKQELVEAISRCQNLLLYCISFQYRARSMSVTFACVRLLFSVVLASIWYG